MWHASRTLLEGLLILADDRTWTTTIQTKHVEDMTTPLAPIGKGIYISEAHANTPGFDGASQPT